jgi:hypothetical protein
MKWLRSNTEHKSAWLLLNPSPGHAIEIQTSWHYSYGVSGMWAPAVVLIYLWIDMSILVKA